jgi:hypothetical protein
MTTASFDNLPQMVVNLTEQVYLLTNKVEQLHSVQSNSETPISTDELCTRLKISEQTANAWRKANKIPYLQIDGVVRYDWNKVILALENSRKVKKG